jgi:hypothetical protein
VSVLRWGVFFFRPDSKTGLKNILVVSVPLVLGVVSLNLEVDISESQGDTSPEAASKAPVRQGVK